jgi:Spy/CpxP family protein refolding chaperone
MKKLLSLFVLFFAFSLSANAQVAAKTQNPEADAKQDLHELTKVIDVSTPNTLFSDLNQLFISKHKMFAQEGNTDAGKEKISQIIDQKLRATLSDEQIKRLEAAKIYTRLTH